MENFNQTTEDKNLEEKINKFVYAGTYFLFGMLAVLQIADLVNGVGLNPFYLTGMILFVAAFVCEVIKNHKTNPGSFKIGIEF